MPNPQTRYVRFLGCDVAKDSVCFHDASTGCAATVANRAADLARFLRVYGSDTLAVCEPTGGYEAVLLGCLAKVGVPAHRADAVRVKAFIRSRGTIAKTDRLDAYGLARYGQERSVELALWTAPAKELAALQALVQRRADLVGMRTAEKNRAQAPGASLIARSCKAMLAAIGKQIEQIESSIKEIFAASPGLAQTAKTLRTVTGIGQKTASVLCALMPELGGLNAKQAAALAGLAPHPNESGAGARYRRMRGGRPQIRKALFMPALAAVRQKGSLRDFFLALTARGKKPIVAVAAVMRKMIVIANARVRDANKNLQQS